jgi:excisionase family DNA binding protein
VEATIMDIQPKDKAPIRLLLSPREAAQALSICEKTLYTITKDGEIPVIRMGRSVRYPVDGLKEWIDKQSQESG